MTTTTSFSDIQDCVLPVLHLGVLRALEIAGKRMLTPQTRGHHWDVPMHQLYQMLDPPVFESLDRLLKGAWEPLIVALTDMGIRPSSRNIIRERLDSYVRSLLMTRRDLRRETLSAMVMDMEVSYG